MYQGVIVWCREVEEKNKGMKNKRGNKGGLVVDAGEKVRGSERRKARIGAKQWQQK